MATTMTIDTELVQTMRDYLVAWNLVQNAEERSDIGRISRLRHERTVAAQVYERALLTRGWRAPAGQSLSLVD